MIEIILHPQWLDNATAGLSGTLRGDLPSLKQQVNHRIAQLWEINTDKGKSWMVSRVETFNHKLPELVICCYKGCDLKRVTQLIHDSAQAQGLGSIRYHTQRKGLNRLVVDLGFAPYETVYKKQLQDHSIWVEEVPAQVPAIRPLSIPIIPTCNKMIMRSRLILMTLVSRILGMRRMSNLI